MAANARRRPLATDGALEIDHAAKLIGFLNTNISPDCNFSAIRAEIINSGQCSAEGITARGSSPVLALCRKLVAAGYDPSAPLEAWRGSTLCLRVRSIGEAAGLEVNGRGTGFKRTGPVGTALPVRQNGSAAREPREPFTFEPIGEAAMRVLEKISPRGAPS
jgi:hypothetical protein